MQNFCRFWLTCSENLPIEKFINLSFGVTNPQARIEGGFDDEFNLGGRIRRDGELRDVGEADGRATRGACLVDLDRRSCRDASASGARPRRGKKVNFLLSNVLAKIDSFSAVSAPIFK